MESLKSWVQLNLFCFILCREAKSLSRDLCTSIIKVEICFAQLDSDFKFIRLRKIWFCFILPSSNLRVISVIWFVWVWVEKGFSLSAFQQAFACLAKRNISRGMKVDSIRRIQFNNKHLRMFAGFSALLFEKFINLLFKLFDTFSSPTEELKLFWR